MNKSTVYKNIFLVLLLLSCSCNIDNGGKHYGLAKQYILKKDYINAKEQIDEALKLDKTNKQFFIYKAIITAKMKNYDESINQLKNIDNYKEDTVYYLIGDVLYDKSRETKYEKDDTILYVNELEKAVTYFDKSLKVNPSREDTYILKYKTLHNLEKYNEAMSTISKAISIFPESSIWYYYRGVTKQAIGDFTGGNSDLTKVINEGKLKSHDIAEAYRFRALGYKGQSNFNSAIKDLNKSLNIDSTQFISYLMRADIYKELNNKEKACKDFRKATDLGYQIGYKEIVNYCN